MREQATWLPEARVQALTQWETRPDGQIVERQELVPPADLCPCSKRDYCEGGWDNEDSCSCESELHCFPGRYHTPMGDG